MKIEEGMYCYNKINRKSGIGKIVGFRENNNAIIKYISDITILSIGNIVASYKLIDLIEEGDYVNGYKVLDILKGFKILVDKLELNTYDGNYYLKQFTNNEIKSIVTKEQFENNCYNVEEQI